jgi:AcrR family transcriptional regulator
MKNKKIRPQTSATIGVDRRAAVMESALTTFARFGYRKTSMEEVARAARISRPGLYFLFASKEELFRDAVSQALEADVGEVERILAQSKRPIRDRLLDAFGRWVARYIGPLSRDIESVIEDNPELLGDIVKRFPRRFEDLIMDAIASSTINSDREMVAAVAQTMISASIGIKHQVVSADAYLERFARVVDLLLR